MNRKLGPWTLATLVLTSIGAAPCLAGVESSERATAVPAAPVTLADPCGQALPLFGNLETLLQLPAPEADEATPVAGGPPRLRTCVCSCGYSCKTDADCGPGGRCGPGITCCARPAADAMPGLAVEDGPAEAPLGT